MKYIDLKKRLNELKRHLLPSKFNRTGIYTDRQYDRFRGYRLQVHAEIEYFFKERSKYVVTEAYKKWLAGKASKRVLPALLAYRNIQFDGSHKLPGLLQNPNYREGELRVRIDETIRVYKNELRNINGIKSDDLIKIFTPIGIDPHHLDQTWLNTMDSFGIDRGSSAHTASRVQQPIDPEMELKNVRFILSGIHALDKQLKNLT